jgi:hypothetical protein
MGLRNLRISQSPALPYALSSAEPMDQPSCFERLIMETQALKSLRLALPLSLLRNHDLMTGTGCPAITYLDVDLMRLSPDVLLGICIALKPTLKLLAICDITLRTDVRDILPIYEALKESIEGLYVTSKYYLTPILHLSFPKLRVLGLQGFLNSMDHWPSQDIQFAQAPIEIIAVKHRSRVGGQDELPVDTVSKFPQLKKLVFLECYDQVDDLPAPLYLAACEARNIECVYLAHEDVSRIMVSLK